MFIRNNLDLEMHTQPIAHALISITEEIRKALNNNKFSCGVFIDFQKAFDTVNH